MNDSATTRLQYPEELLKKYPDVLEPHALKIIAIKPTA